MPIKPPSRRSLASAQLLLSPAMDVDQSPDSLAIIPFNSSPPATSTDYLTYNGCIGNFRNVSDQVKLPSLLPKKFLNSNITADKQGKKKQPRP